MKKRLILTPLLLALGLAACGANNEVGPVYQRITASQAKAMMAEGEPYILLDVRTEEEFSEKHIPGAILIPDFEIATRAEAELSDKDALILVYCRSGRRSVDAAKVLVEMGFTNVYDFGGILDWPYEIVE